jgi:hypothetical protein
MKAFLSHSWEDKELVSAVAKELGRQFCVVDSQAFSTGNEFKHSIEKGLDDSSTFVLFASKASLASVWVNFEIDEAWMNKLQKKLSSALVYIIDSSVTHLDMPEWLRRGLIRNENSAKIIARDIRAHLDELLRNRQSPFFTGRRMEIEKIESAMMPIDGSTPPRALILVGLPGIGRRSLIKKTSPSILNFNKFVEIQVGEGDHINDVCAIIADRVEPYSTKQGLKRIIDEIQTLSEEAALERTLNNLRKTVEARELPILVDRGGLLDNNGYLTPPIKNILNALSPNGEIYIYLITTRRPQDNPLYTPEVIPVRPLQEKGNSSIIWGNFTIHINNQ